MLNDAPKTLTVAEAGARYFGLCRASSYAAVQRGEIPVIKIGRLLRVPVAALERMMQGPGNAGAAK
jgi:excisionase family DNA binding protein